MRAFQYAKDYSKSKIDDKYGPDYIQKKEFRIFLVALRQRFEYWEAFKKVDSGADRRIDLKEFTAALG